MTSGLRAATVSKSMPSRSTTQPEVLHNDVAALRQLSTTDPVGVEIDGETAFTPIAVRVQPPDVVGPVTR